MTVRVIRVLEYEYRDLDEAVKDMGRWGVSPIGPRPTWWFQEQGYPKIHSTIIGPLPGGVSEPALDVPNEVLKGREQHDGH